MENDKLFNMLLAVDSKSIIGVTIHSTVQMGGNLGQLVLELQSMYADNPQGMREILGDDLATYLLKPFNKKQLIVSYANNPIVGYKRGRKPKAKG